MSVCQYPKLVPMKVNGWFLFVEALENHVYDSNAPATDD